MTPRHTAARSAAPIALLVLALMVGLVVASSVSAPARKASAEGGTHDRRHRTGPSFDDGGARTDDDRALGGAGRRGGR